MLKNLERFKMIAMQTYVLAHEPFDMTHITQEKLSRYLSLASGKSPKKERLKMELVTLPERPKPKEGRYRMPKRNQPGKLS